MQIFKIKSIDENIDEKINLKKQLLLLLEHK